MVMSMPLNVNYTASLLAVETFQSEDTQKRDRLSWIPGVETVWLLLGMRQKQVRYLFKHEALLH